MAEEYEMFVKADSVLDVIGTVEFAKIFGGKYKRHSFKQIKKFGWRRKKQALITLVFQSESSADEFLFIWRYFKT